VKLVKDVGSVFSLKHGDSFLPGEKLNSHAGVEYFEIFHLKFKLKWFL
jgi:hypothetical protein